MGGAHERVTTQHCGRFSLTGINPLNICAIEVVAGEGARVLPLAPGLDDGLFEHDGQITKREIRAMTLSALAPRRGELLWDIGAGSGSIGIEWMLSDPSMRAIAIEAFGGARRAHRRNAATFGVPGLDRRRGHGARRASPACRARMRSSSAAAAAKRASWMRRLLRLQAGGRLVANAVTTEMEAVLLADHARRGGSLIRIDIARAAPSAP